MPARLLTALLGIWLMAAPAALRFGGLSAANDRVVGPLSAAFALIAIFPATRSLRRINRILGLWWLAAPWFWSDPWPARISDCVTGLIICGLAFIAAPAREHLGTGWAGLWHYSSALTALPARHH